MAENCTCHEEKRLSMWQRMWHRVRMVTWSCPRCGRPFATEMERNIHMMSCGS
ncbi:MAG: hypothetical protein IJ111_02545 [Eggerthellaceae bacterium]|nr:hypothetical protein [Eggerthellaceae bacterium]